MLSNKPFSLAVFSLLVFANLDGFMSAIIIENARVYDWNPRMSYETRVFVKEYSRAIKIQNLPSANLKDVRKIQGKIDVEKYKHYKSIYPEVFENVKEIEDKVKLSSSVSIPCTIFKPKNFKANSPVVFFLYDTGISVLTKDTYRPSLAHLAFSTGAIIVSIGYRGTPEHKFSTCLSDAKSVIKFYMANKKRIDHRISGSKFGIAGDCLGASLASAISNKVAGVDFQILIHGLFNGSATNPSFSKYTDKQYLVTPKLLAFSVANYFEKGQATTPDATTLLLIKKSTPKTLLIVTELDPTYDDSIQYAAKLEQFGVSYELHTLKGSVHFYFGNPHLNPCAFGKTIDYVKSFLKEH